MVDKSQLDYLDCLVKSFASWYESGRDVWSPEPEMRGLISLAEKKARGICDEIGFE
jgi:hypothetical protein